MCQQFISGEVKVIVSSLNSYSNQGTSLHKQLHPTENCLAGTWYSTIIFHNFIILEIRGKKILIYRLGAHLQLSGDLKGVYSQLFSLLMIEQKVASIKRRECAEVQLYDTLPAPQFTTQLDGKGSFNNNIKILWNFQEQSSVSFVRQRTGKQTFSLLQTISTSRC